MYARRRARSGAKWIVISVPNVIPISDDPTTAIAATRSVPGRPSSRM
jgi:hypothetical protein